MTTVHPALSFEYSHPLHTQAASRYSTPLPSLRGTNPDYVSVTYAGDAKRRQKTLALLDHLVHETLPHPRWLT